MGTRLSSTSSDSRALASGTLPVQRLHALRSLYADWQKNPSAIPQSWRNLLAQLAPGTIAHLKLQDRTKTTPPAPGDRASEHASQPIEPQHVGPQHVGLQHVGPQQVGLQHVDPKPAMPKPAAPKSAMPKPAAPKSAMPKPAAPMPCFTGPTRFEHSC